MPQKTRRKKKGPLGNPTRGTKGEKRKHGKTSKGDFQKAGNLDSDKKKTENAEPDPKGIQKNLNKRDHRSDTAGVAWGYFNNLVKGNKISWNLKRPKEKKNASVRKKNDANKKKSPLSSRRRKLKEMK